MIASVLTNAARYHVEAADCFDFAARIPDGAVNLLWLDGPYNMGKAAWDTFATVAEMLAFYDRVFVEAQRVLAPNGSLYVCTSTAMGARMECKIAQRFEVLNNIRWAKPPGSTKAEMFDKEICRSFFPSSETVIFAEQFGSDDGAMNEAGYQSQCEAAKVSVIGAYLAAELKRARVTNKEIAALFPSRTGGLTGCVSNWLLGFNMPTADQYATIRSYLNRTPDGAGEYLRKDYEELRKDYEELRRPFSVSASVPYVDTWTYSTVPTQTGKHPCEKPPDMIRDVIAASSRPGDVVCEWFAGSGVGGEQATLQGRRYLGCDSDPEWATRARARIERAEREPHRAGAPIRATAAHPSQASLFGGAK